MRPESHAISLGAMDTARVLLYTMTEE